MLISTNSLFQKVFSKKSLKLLKKGIKKLSMIRRFIYETYKSYKLDKENQSTLKNILKVRWTDDLLRISNNVLLLVQMYY